MVRGQLKESRISQIPKNAHGALGSAQRRLLSRTAYIIPRTTAQKIHTRCNPKFSAATAASAGPSIQAACDGGVQEWVVIAAAGLADRLVHGTVEEYILPQTSTSVSWTNATANSAVPQDDRLLRS